MADVAGLVVGVIATWSACVHVFDIVDSGKNYGMDYELLRIKLEVERIRLLAWGEAVGLVGVGPGPDARLNREDYRDTVLRLLGCIQGVFENSARLQEAYGLQPTAPSASDRQNNDLRLAQQPRVLGLVFKRAYESLRRSAVDRRRATPLGKKAIWAIRDKKKFQDMVLEIKGFNDNLESLFPDVKLKTRDLIRTDIGESEEVRDLRLVQQATEGEHEDISDTASIRLGVLRAATTARSASALSGGAQTSTGPEQSLSGNPWSCQVPPPGGDGVDLDAPTSGPGTRMEEHYEEMQEVELYFRKKSQGALWLFLTRPHLSDKVVATVSWKGVHYDREIKLPRWNEEIMGFVEMSHASFDLYRRKTFTKEPQPVKYSDFNQDNPHDIYDLAADIYDLATDEDNVLFDVESDPKYENVNPGTVTVEGFGKECWDYEKRFSRRDDKPTIERYAKIPDIPPKKLLRRLGELRRGRPSFGWRDEGNLMEFAGSMGLEQFTASTTSLDREVSRLADLYSLINQREIAADFTLGTSITLQFIGSERENIRLWKFLWQIIITAELAWRMEHYPRASVAGCTPKVLASLIVAELWLKNVEIVLEDDRILLADIKKPETLQEKAIAEDFKSRGNQAMKNGQYQEAVDLYAEAIKVDLSSAVYRANRSAALLPIGKFKEACDDAYIATQLDPKYAKAWSRLGIAHLKLCNWKKARDAYLRAIEVAGEHATNLMRQGLSHANAKIGEELRAIEKETDQAAKDILRKNYLDQDWDIVHKRLSFHSRVHEQQVEGLLIFAQHLKWPYVNEVLGFAGDAYKKLQDGQEIPRDLIDWLFGMTLPGKWMSHKIMSALVHCTPSIAAEVATAYYSGDGLSLPKQTYWRVRSVLGCVLGCLPGVVSLCGWIGPCPPIEFIPPLAGSKPRHIRLNARSIAPEGWDSESDDVVHLPAEYRQGDTQIQPRKLMAEMKDPNRWVIPEPPAREVSACSIQAIQLQKLPLDANAVGRRASKELIDMEVDRETRYRARIIFNMDNNEDPIMYTLYTNPVFVTLPPCHVGQEGPPIHEVHLWKMPPSYQNNIWTVKRLKDHTPEDFNDDFMVINATGSGAEVLARAWCSERGRNALIRRSGGPCYTCAFWAARRAGLGVATLIWVS